MLDKTILLVEIILSLLYDSLELHLITSIMRKLLLSQNISFYVALAG